jgi:hypothetical protein
MRFGKILFVSCGLVLFAGLTARQSAAPQAPSILWIADGGHPLPPPPVMLADGGHPLPPPPQMLADGGHPLPPPPSASVDIGTAA